MSTGQHSERPLAARVRGSNLLVLTSLAAVDGTIFLLAAGGALATWSGAVVAGLTVVGGAGAWVTAQQEFGQRDLRRRDYAELGAIAVVATLATVAAAALGSLLAGTVDLLVLPKAAGVVIILVAAEIGGADLPRLRGVPLTVAALLAASALEVIAWIL